MCVCSDTKENQCCSLPYTQEHGKPPLPASTLLDLFTNKINHTEVRLAALFDLFTSQCDRHPQNYFLNDRGKLFAIDNDQVSGVWVWVW